MAGDEPGVIRVLPTIAAKLAEAVAGRPTGRGRMPSSAETRFARGAGRWLVAVRVLVARGNRGRSDLAATRREVPRSAADPGNR
jgi:hypothetical protein